MASPVVIDFQSSNSKKNELNFNATFPDVIQYLPSEQVKALINENKNDSEFINRRGAQTGFTALHWACVKNDIELVKILVFDCKVDVNSRGSVGETPIFVCVKNGNFTAFDFLVTNGADINIRDDYSRSIIHWAAYTGRIAVFHYLKKYYQISFNDVDQYNQNPLMIACATKNGDLARYLIRSKEFDMHHQDLNGNTCLHMAVKSGLPRLTHLICTTGGKSLMNVQNKNHQIPIDMIINEREPVYEKIRSWLKFECQNKSDALSKFYENYYWFINFSLTALFLDVPLIFNRILFDSQNYTFLKGFIQFVPLIGFARVFTNLNHRVNYITGAMNPFHMGFFVIMFLNNYIQFYMVYLDTFEVTNIIHLIYVTLTFLHIYVFIKMLRMDPGVVRESCRKSNGAEYELRDLLKLREHGVSGIDNVLDDNIDNLPGNPDELIFCESCLIVTKKPTKHCKLCETCYSHFDHHCVFVNKCIALENHKYFVLLLILTIIGEVVYLPYVFYYFKDIYYNLPPETSSIISYVLSTTLDSNLILVACFNAAATPMVIGLLLYQLNIVSHGFTQQFKPLNMHFMGLSISQKIENLRVFFLRSSYERKKLFEKQNEAALKIDNKPSGYPTDSCNSSGHHGHSHGFGF